MSPNPLPLTLILYRQLCGFTVALLERKQLPFVLARVLLSFIFLTATAADILTIASDIVLDENIFRRDLNQWVVSALAIRAGENPYAPIPDLTLRFFNAEVPRVNPHPTPYPPPFILVMSPLSFVSPVVAAIGWLCINVVFIFHSAALLLSAFTTRRSLFLIIAGGFALFSLPPVREDLLFGQCTILLFWLISHFLVAYLNCRDRHAGFFLGSVIAVKFFAYPLLLLCLFRKERIVAVMSIVVVLGSYAASTLVMGFETIVGYFRDTSPYVVSLWLPAPANLSLASIPAKFFSPPSYSWPIGAGIRLPLSADNLHPYALPLGSAIIFVSLLLLVWAGRHEERGKSVSRGIAASIITQPIAWPFSLVFLTIPLLWAAKELSRGHRVLANGILIFLGVGIVSGFNLGGIGRLVLPRTAVDELLVVPPLALFLFCIPTFLCLYIALNPRDSSLK